VILFCFYDNLFIQKNIKVALEYSKKYTTNLVRVLTLDINRGKGGAVRMVINIIKLSLHFFKLYSNF